MFSDSSVVWLYRQVVVPAPPGLKAWAVYEYDETVEGPIPVLALGFTVATLQERVEATYEERKQRGCPFPHFDLREALHEEFDFTPCMLLFQVDGFEGAPWHELNTQAFFTKEAAYERLEEIKRKNRAKALAPAAQPRKTEVEKTS